MKTTKDGWSKMLLLGMILFTFCTLNANAGPFEYYEVYGVSIVANENLKEVISKQDKVAKADGGGRMSILPNELYYKIKHYADNEMNAKLNTWYDFVFSPFGMNGTDVVSVLIKWTKGNNYEWYGWRF